LDDCLYETKILLSTTTEIPQPKTNLIDQGCIEALFDAYKDGDEGIKEGVMVWLIRLSDDQGGRKRILRIGLDPILASIGNIDGNSTLWLTATALLVELSKYKDSVDRLATTGVVDALNRLKNSANPVAKLAAANLYSSLLQSENGRNAVARIAMQQNELVLLTNETAGAALNAAILSIIPREPTSSNPVLNPWTTSEVLLRAVAFGVFGSVWGQIRWWIYARRNGLYGPELKRFLRKRKTGRYVFTLMALDILAQALMMWPKEGVIVPLISNEPIHFPNLGVPQTTAVPIGEAGLITLLSLWSIRTQRYVVLPMLLASLQSHWDTIDKYTKPYQEVLGVDINRIPYFIYNQVKLGVVTATEIAQGVTSSEEKKNQK